MLTTIAVVALCAMLGAYWLGESDALADRRDRWSRRRDLYDAALHDEHDFLSPPYGAVAGDTDTVPLLLEPAPKRMQRRWRRRWFANSVLACSICSGPYWAGLTLAWWTAGARLTDQPPPVTWVTAPLVWGAASGAHVMIMWAAHMLRDLGPTELEPIVGVLDERP